MTETELEAQSAAEKPASETETPTPTVKTEDEAVAVETREDESSVQETMLETITSKAADFFRPWITIRNRPGSWGSLAAGGLCITVLLTLWYVLTLGEPETRIIDNMTLPSLKETINSFQSLWFDRALARSAVWSLGRVLGGFLLAAAVGIPLGVCASSFKRLRAFLRPMSIFGRNIPIAALIPLTLIWFGLGETQKVMFIFFASVAFVFFDSVTAVDEVPDSYLDTAYTLGARFTPKHGATWSAVVALGYAVMFFTAYLLLTESPAATDDPALLTSWRWGIVVSTLVGFGVGFMLWFPIISFQVVRKVLLPLSLPDIVNSLRLLFGLAFGYIMLAEVINARHGLGSIIILSQRRGPREHIYLALIIIALMAFGIDRLVLYAQRRLFPYRQTGKG